MDEKNLRLISKTFSRILSFLMIIIGILIMGVLLINIAQLAMLLFDPDSRYDALAESILSTFLFFELADLVRGYFIKNSHVSIENFLYIGVTAIIRMMLIVHGDAVNTLVLSISVFVLIIGLTIYRFFRKTTFTPKAKK